MNQSSNVVTLDRSDFKSQTRAQQLIDQSGQITVKYLGALVQRMLDNADDTLFEMADKAESNAIQTQYFDAMRELRIMRKQLEEEFTGELKNGFRQFSQGRKRSPDLSAPQELTLESLSLVDENELEESLAVTGMVQKINNLFSRELYALEQRTLHLHPGRRLTQEDLPFGPQHICEAFRTAAQHLDSGTEIKLIILKLFDKHVATNIGTLFEELNGLFVQAGIIPDLRASLPKTDNPAPAPAAGHPPGHAPNAFETTSLTDTVLANGAGYPLSPPGNNVLTSLQHLLTGQQGGEYGAAPLIAELTPAQPHQPSTIATSDDLIAALSALQHQGLGAQPGVPALDIRSALSGEITRGIPTGTAAKIDSIDNDIIDIVAMLFDTILEDPNLPTVAKALIGQLQIPIIKVAIADKAFFNKKQHPARKLLNELARSAVGLDEHSQREDSPLLNTITLIVQRIQNDFERDIGLFAELLDELTEFLAEEAKREAMSLNEAREATASREHRELAAAWVTETIVDHINGRDIPRPVYELLIGPWKDVMLHTYLDQGENCTLWKDQTRFIDLLMWSVTPKHSARDKKRLTGIIQQLIRTLHESLTTIDYAETRIDKLMLTLQAIHLASLRGEMESDAVPKVKVVTDTGHTGHPPDSGDDINDALASMREQLDAMADFEKMLNEPLLGEDEYKPLKRGFETAAQDAAEVEEIALEDLYGPPPTQTPIIEDEFWEQVCTLKTGRWVEFTQDGGKPKRLKLAWKSEMLGECTFVNWKFQVGADISLAEFANRLRNGSAAIIDELPLFERAMDGVYNRLIKSSPQA